MSPQCRSQTSSHLFLQNSCSATLPPSRPRPRSRTLSLTSLCSVQSRITLDFVNADTALVTLHPLAHDVHGSFTPTASAQAALQYLTTNSKNSAPRIFNSTHRSRPQFMWPSNDDSPLSSGPPSPTISTSHTTSPYFTPGGLSRASTSSSTLISGYQQGHKRMTSDEPNPIFAKLERKSKLLSQNALCSTCNKQGSGYPKCGSCNAMWCSRECRLAGGKRHVCSHKMAK
jgi:hypothetical protein